MADPMSNNVRDSFEKVGELAVMNMHLAALYGKIPCAPCGGAGELPANSKGCRKRLPREAPALTPELFRAADEARATSQTLPAVEILRAGLKSPLLRDKIGAALWVAKLDSDPKFERLHTPLRRAAIAVLLAVVTRRTSPALTAAAYVELCCEVIAHLYEKAPSSANTQRSVEQMNEQARSEREMLQSCTTPAELREKIMAGMKPRRPRPVNR